ncbi:methyltransferase domain-containing protein [Streptantibioticus rubrisoli]|uniref:Methyltransferase domain-containing protein n=1 Tax=Streptantibioticus rubrisoli TaxID=1387313 RepID=A0ABT1P6S6_9ACTN|nr:class I SAM-dependent methyltransferase [Streptantibioticus rubrisoli]MCQ4041042.1 methyltransferase domain-containing protein [Streptantibioticus rubrisoli]
MTGNVKTQHDWQSAEYVKQWIDFAASAGEQRQLRLRRAASLLPLSRSHHVRVLDLGGGYGEFARQVLTEFPAATVCLQDYSAPMIDRAREVLAEFGQRVVYRHCDLRDPSWVKEVDGPFDAVVSSLAAHNLGDPVTVRKVYGQVHSLLRPGGWFFNLDLVLDVVMSPPNSPLAALYARGHGQRRDAHEDTHSRERFTELTLEGNLGWLREAGFDDVDCVRKEFDHVFLAAHRRT